MDRLDLKKAREIFDQMKLDEVSKSLTWSGSNSDGWWCMAKGFIDGYEAGIADAMEVLRKTDMWWEDKVRYNGMIRKLLKS